MTRYAYSFSLWMRLSFAFLLLLSTAASWAAVPLPRIGARARYPTAEFYNKASGARFVPQGNNYIKFQDHHAVFDIGSYDGSATEAALAQMQAAGYNITRVFIDPFRVAGTGFTATLSSGYMANFFDFLGRARAHAIYVIPVLSLHAFNSYYNSFLPNPRPSDMEDPNIYLLHPGYFDAKAAYVSEFVLEIKQASPDLLSTIFSYEVENELYLTNFTKPFSLGSGIVLTAKGSCDMASASSRQACMDDNVVLWANRMVAAVHSQDPEAMVSASVYSYKAVGKSGPNGLLPLGLPQEQSSFPARPKVLLDRTDLSYIDFHSSPSGGDYALHLDLESSEFQLMDKTTRPFLLGEFGAIKGVFQNLITNAAYAMREHRSNANDLGFGGSLFWVWEPYVDTRFWGVLENSGAINGQLAPVVQFSRPRIDFEMAKWDGDTLPDLVAIQRSQTASQRTEISIASGASGFQTLIYNRATVFPPAGEEWEFELADWDQDGRPDLFGIKKSSTGTQKTEVHIASSSSGFQSYVFQAGTVFPMTGSEMDFELAYWDSDNLPDLVGIKKSGTGSLKTEVHIASGASNFQSYIFQLDSIFGMTGSEMDFELAYWDGDNRPDLIGIKKSATGTGRTEIHIASGSSNFRQYIGNTGTVFPPTGANMDFELARWDEKGLGTVDLIGIKKANTGTAKTEVHIAPGNGLFSQYVLKTATAFPEAQ